MDHRDQRVTVETARLRITGRLRLPRDGYRSRLTDYLNASDRSFMPLTDVEIGPLDGSGPSEPRDFVAISIEQIVPAPVAKRRSSRSRVYDVGEGAGNEPQRISSFSREIQSR